MINSDRLFVCTADWYGVLKLGGLKWSADAILTVATFELFGLPRSFGPLPAEPLRLVTARRGEIDQVSDVDGSKDIEDMKS